MMGPANLVWRCEACGDWRDDGDITVVTADVSDRFGLRAGTAERCVNHCADREACKAKALAMLQTFGVRRAD